MLFFVDGHDGVTTKNLFDSFSSFSYFWLFQGSSWRRMMMVTFLGEAFLVTVLAPPDWEDEMLHHAVAGFRPSHLRQCF